MTKPVAITMMLLMVPGAARAQATATPLQTRPERTNFNETSHYDDVMAFMDAAAKVAPRLIHLTTFGKTFEGRVLPLAIVGAPEATAEAVRRTGKLRVHIQGNIHAGEVEGKESAQMLLRELAEGKHADWLKSMVLIIAPICRFTQSSNGRDRMSRSCSVTSSKKRIRTTDTSWTAGRM